MALEPISARQLAGTTTLFASFMGHVGRSHKTFEELLAIYRRRGRTLDPWQDRDNNLRVERFMRAMASSRWDGDVVLRIGVFDGATLVIDGIHRGLAYLGCVQEGVSPDRLPALHVSR